MVAFSVCPYMLFSVLKSIPHQVTKNRVPSGACQALTCSSMVCEDATDLEQIRKASRPPSERRARAESASCHPGWTGAQRGVALFTVRSSYKNCRCATLVASRATGPMSRIGFSSSFDRKNAHPGSVLEMYQELTAGTAFSDGRARTGSHPLQTLRQNFRSSPVRSELSAPPVFLTHVASWKTAADSLISWPSRVASTVAAPNHHHRRASAAGLGLALRVLGT